MKWILKTYLLLLIISTLSSATQLNIEDGYSSSNNGYVFTVCRNPFCAGGPAVTSCNTNFNVFIVLPENGSNYYFPSVTENVTVSIIGSSSPVSCYYQVGGTWNTFNHCGVGENATWDMVTFPEGYPVDLIVNITVSCGEVLNNSKVYVWYTPGYEAGDDIVLIILVTFFLMYIFWRYRRKKRLKQAQTSYYLRR